MKPEAVSRTLLNRRWTPIGADDVENRGGAQGVHLRLSAFALTFKRGMIMAGVAALAACTVGPDYVRPPVEVPGTYKELGDWKVAQPADDAPRGNWWEVFGDQQLNGLVSQVQISNFNVAIAEAQYRQAQALAAQSRAALFPSVSASASGIRSGAGSASTRSGVGNAYNVSLNASWEADVWGRVHRSVEAGAATAQASAANLGAAQLSAQAELATSYFQLRILDAQRQLLDDSVAAYQRSLDLTRNRYAGGVAAKVDVVQAEAQLKSTQAQAVDVGVQRAQLEHAIAVLIGKPPAEFSIAPVPLKFAMPAIPVAMPSELLQRRPDIAASERQVAAANARIGVAEAAFFPSLTLSGSVGSTTSTFPLLLSAPTRVWSIGPQIAQFIFDAGLRKAQTDQAIALYDANVASYRQTVLEAFQEVEDNLAALRILDREAAIQEEAVQAARQSVALTLNQYKAGTVSFLNVVIVQTAQLNNERTLVGILGRRLSAAVALVRALGGGWQAPAPGSPVLPAGENKP
jgi:NodT family efflux transporter outer membrane factor (OMF) lipoprotein